MELKQKMKASYATLIAVALVASAVQTATARSEQHRDEGCPPSAANGLFGSIPGGLPVDIEKIINPLSSQPIRIPRIAVPTKVRVSSGVNAHTLNQEGESALSAGCLTPARCWDARSPRQYRREWECFLC